MKFNISTECEDGHELSSLNELNWAVDRLIHEPGSFLCLVPEYAIDSVTYIQATYIREKKGFFKKKIVATYYQVEAQEEKRNGDLIQYFFKTEAQEDVWQIFYAFYDSLTIPDLENWRRELFYKAKS